MADPTANGKILVDFSTLTLRDLARARVILGGVDPYEVASGEGIVQLVVWCKRSRTQPDLPWDAALDVEVGELEWPASRERPPTPTRASSGKSKTTRVGRSSGRKRNGSEPEPSSAPTTASTATSTSS
jgi:hypothetical protein